MFSAFGPYLAEAESAGARLRVRARPTWLIAGEMVGLIRKRSGQGLNRPARWAGGPAGDAADLRILTNGGSRP